MKPIIGVLPLWNDEKQCYWMFEEYFEGIQRNGGIPIMLPFSSDIQEACKICNGFLFTGGQDVNPLLYHQERKENVFPCEKRDQLEFDVLEYALQNKKSVLGICRGIQLINVYFQGTLIQDIPSCIQTNTIHKQSKPYDTGIHFVSILKDTPLYSLLHKETLFVNSLHHQVIDILGNGLKEMAISSDGLIEAIYKEDHPFLWAVQWHPEYINDKESDLIFKNFIEASKNT